MATKQYHIITYGCQMNKSDDERIAGLLEKKGWQKAEKMGEADLIVANMCSVRQSAVDRIYGLIPKFKELKKRNPRLKTIATGCILSKDKRKLSEKIDYILKKEELKKWEKVIASHFEGKDTPFSSFFQIEPLYSSRFSASIPLSNGCSMYCSYCAVPFTRGKEICRPHTEIIKETKSLTQKGYKEIWLLGQIVNSYRSPSNPRIGLAEIIKQVNSFPGKFWLRFTSPHPAFFNDKLIKTIAESEKFNPYLNLPLQSGDNEILKKMERGYSIEEYVALVEKIRKAFRKYRKGLEKTIALSTDIIVGFPGETEKQFRNTIKIFKKIGFDMAYIAQYSPRSGTKAAKMPDNVPKEEKKQREKKLSEFLQKSALKRNKAFIGKKITVLPFEYKKGYLFGKSFHYKTVRFKGSKTLLGEFVKVDITKALAWGLEGRICGSNR